MKYGFSVYKAEAEERAFWIAESKDLKGCTGQGETLEEALEELVVNEKEWLITAKEYGIEIPEPTVETASEYKGE